MHGVNKVILVGRIGQDPEIKSLPSGQQVVNLSLATNERWTDKQTQEQKSNTEWHSVIAFGKLADLISKYVFKGFAVYVEGTLKTQKWQTETGDQKSKTSVIVRSIQFLDSKPDQQPQAPSEPHPKEYRDELNNLPF